MTVAPALLLALLAAAVPGGTTAAVESPASVATASETVELVSEKLEAGLASIVAAKIRSDLYFIASDEMRGRDTVSPEQRIAARFIRARLQRLGFQPGNGEKFLYEYPLEMKALDRDSLKAEFKLGDLAAELTYGQDYVMTSGFGVADMDNDAGVVFCGDGEFGDPVKGKWALCTKGESSSFGLRRRAQRAGAVGLIMMAYDGNNMDVGGADLIAEYEGSDARAFKGNIAWPGQGNRWGAPFPVCAINHTTALAMAGPDPLVVGQELLASFHEVRKLSEGSDVMAENVIGIWPGSDPELSKEVLIVSAHYDHVGVRGGEVYNGADDNGSGTTGMLALAEALTEYGPMRRSVMLIWVSGEEKGLWGSKAWALNPSLPEGMKAIANLNIDMIGRKAPNELYVTPSSKHEGYNELTRSVERFAKIEGFGNFPEGIEQGFEGLGSADIYYTRSDHAEFAKLGIPVCFLFAGEHEDYHKATDTPEKIDYDKISRVTRVVLRMLDSLQGDKLDF